MDRDEFKVLVKGMKAVYAQPTFIPDQDAFNIWFELLKDLPYRQANLAIQKYMLTERFPPTIADLRAKAVEVSEKPLEEMSELEAWAIVRKAIGNSGYNSVEEFNKLPEVCQIAVGTPENLHEWSQMESDQVATVEQSHFIRNYRAAAKRLSKEKKLPENIRNLIAGMREEKAQIEQKNQPVIETVEEPEEERKIGMSEETRKKLDEMLSGIRNKSKEEK